MTTPLSNRGALSFDDMMSNFDKNEGNIQLHEEVAQNVQEFPNKEFDQTREGIIDATARHGAQAGLGVVQGWYLDVPENLVKQAEPLRPEFDEGILNPKIEMHSGEEDTLWNTMLMINVPALQNYDPDKPNIFLMSNSEFMALKKEDKLSYLPQIVDPDSVAGNFTREVFKVARGYSFGRNVTGIIKTPGLTGTARAARESADFIGAGAIASQIAFDPYEKRLGNYANEILSILPAEALRPFLEWIAADNNDTVAESRVKMLVEALVLEGMFEGVWRTVKGVRNLIKNKNKGKQQEQESLKEIHDAETRPLLESEKHSSRQEATATPKKSRKASTSDTILGDAEVGSTVNAYNIFRDPTQIKELAKDIVDRGIENGPVVSGKAVFNRTHLQDTEPQAALKIYESTIAAELRSRKTGGTKTVEQITDEAGVLRDAIDQKTGDRIERLLSDTAEQLDLETDALRIAIRADVDDVVGIESRMLAYRGLIAQLGSDMYHVADLVAKKPGDLKYQAELLNIVSYTEETLLLYGRMRGSVARATMAHRIPIYKPNRDGSVKQIDLETFNAAMQASGTDPSKIKMLAEAIKFGDNSLQRARNGVRGLESVQRRGMRAITEFYRSGLLWSIPSNVTNTLSGAIETVIAPASHLIGGIHNRDIETIKYAGREMVGFFTAVGPSFRHMLTALLDERNILDPMGTKIDGMWSPFGPAISRRYHNDSNWSPNNWLSLAINTVGKVSRFSVRLLGGEDEFIKQINYRMRAYAEITGSLPDKLSSLKYNAPERKEFIRTELKKYFDQAGKATNKNLEQHARRVTFTQPLQKGTLAHLVQGGLQKTGYMPFSFFTPFVRTPANIFDTFKIRTPLLNKYVRTHQAMLKSEDPIERAQAVGNTAIGMMLYGTTIYLLSSGKLTGSGPTDPNRQALWRQNNRPYSVQAPDGTWHSYNRFDPHAMPLAYFASTWENMYTYQEDPNDLTQIISHGIAGFLKAASDRTYLQGIKQIFDIINNIMMGNSDRPMREFGKLGANLIPPIINQVSDITGHLLYGESAAFNEAFTFKDQVNRRLAPLNQYGAVKHHWITGEPMVTPSGFNFGLSMGKNDTKDVVLKELLATGRSFSPPSPDIRGVPLSADQYSELTQTIGTMQVGGLNLYETLEKVIKPKEYDYNEGWLFDPEVDDYKIKTLKKILNTFKAAGKEIVLAKYPALLEQVENLQRNEASIMEKGGLGRIFFDVHDVPSAKTNYFGNYLD